MRSDLRISGHAVPILKKIPLSLLPTSLTCLPGPNVGRRDSGIVARLASSDRHCECTSKCGYGEESVRCNFTITNAAKPVGL